MEQRGKRNMSHENSNVKLSENTTVKLSLVVLGLGFICGAVWWAATLQSKVDALITSMASLSTQVAHYNTEVSALRHKVELLDKVGSSAMQSLIEDVRRLDGRLKETQRQ